MTLSRRMGGIGSKSAHHFRECILEVGGSLDFMQQYIKFRGGKPKIEGLIKGFWNYSKSFLNWVKCLQLSNKFDM